MIGTSLPPEWPIPVPICGIDHQKFNCLLTSDTLAVGGCWGQRILWLWRLVNKTQISTPPEHTRHHDSRNYQSEPFTLARFNMRHPVVKVAASSTSSTSEDKHQKPTRLTCSRGVPSYAIGIRHTVHPAKVEFLRINHSMLGDAQYKSRNLTTLWWLL